MISLLLVVVAAKSLLASDEDDEVAFLDLNVGVLVALLDSAARTGAAVDGAAFEEGFRGASNRVRSRAKT